MILPDTAETRGGHLFVGGCDTLELAREFGTPLYVYDEATIRGRARAYLQAFATRYPNVLLCYAAKAFINSWLARLLNEEGFGLDVVSGGEIAVASRAGFPMAKVHFHGNNKLREELDLALDRGVGRIVIDNTGEIELLDGLAHARRTVAEVWLRIAPGIEAHTHDYLRTGGAYTKFGVPLMTGEAAQAVEQIVACQHLKLVGFHAHIGSQIFDLLPYEETVETLMRFALQMQEQHHVELLEVSPGGGLGIQYTAADDPPAIDDLAGTIAGVMRHMAARFHMELPKLVLEPGRSIVGPAGVTLYTAGSIKAIPGKPSYVAVDGGMADNIRPALYQAKYQVLAAGKMDAARDQNVTIAGKYCESGDILVADVAVPDIQSGDVLAVAATGAYCIPLASNYNVSLKPPIVAVKDGRATLLRRRESIEDIMACEMS
ncbi:MAG TPA: diaminopimelate decarboxylase [Chloroflexota bacterium]|nr:diaminopimelate decarboxylase [Chloroflexota bacterium]